MRELEVIRRRPRVETRRAPLLFVHGAHSAAWCWDVHFLPYFAERGFDCHALSLRGHGGSDGHDELVHTGLDDYVQDVASVASRLASVPVVIGHSMGGAIAQRFADAGRVAGLVLLGSVPPQGLWGSAVELWWRDPSLAVQLALVQSGQTHLANVAAVRAALFSDSMPDDLAAGYLARMQMESQRALLDLSWMHLYRERRVQTAPLLVLGGELDGLFPPSVVEGTARWYGTDAEIIPDVGHVMMLEPRWRDVADRIANWLDAHRL